MTESDENQAQLTPRQITALPCFATNASIESSCEAADISRETYYKWLKNPLFKSELDRLRNEIVSGAKNSASRELLRFKSNCNRKTLWLFASMLASVPEISATKKKVDE